MRHAIPPMHEEVAALKERLQHTHDGHKQPRLPMLDLLATRQARDRQEAARLLGVHRNTVSRWLARYAVGGWDALLATHIPAGKPVSLAPAVLASLAQAPRRTEGFASYEALRPWVRQTHGVEVKDQTLYTLVRARFKTTLNVARPSHTKKPRRHGRLPGELSRPPAAGHPARQHAPYPGL
jgi:transposase